MKKDDDWIAAAMEDDLVVAQELLRLRRSSWIEAKPAAAILSLPPIVWGHRQPRSRSTVNGSRKERETTTRCSPTTPLSWSGESGGGGDASPSDCYDESSQPSDPSSFSRSKGASANEYSSTTTSKKSRKKKTFAELRDEDTVLLKERVHLKKELPSLKVTLLEQRARSENLKRIKLDLNVELPNKVAETSHEPEPVFSNQFNDVLAPSFHNTHSVWSRYTTHDDQASYETCKEQKVMEMQEKGFILPDLNMMPSDEETFS